MAAARYSRNQGYVVTRKKVASRATMRTTARRFTIGPTAAKFAGIAVLGVLALVLTNLNVRDSGTLYKEARLRQSMSNEQAQIMRLNYEVSRAQSIKNISDTPRKDQLVPATEVGRVTEETGQVAGVATP